MSERLRQTLMLQWKAARWPLLPFVLASFGLPLAAMTTAGAAGEREVFSAGMVTLLVMQQWLVLLPLTAALLGLTIGLTAWAWDHRANHVYALALPIERWRYALLKLVAGVLVLLIPVVAAWAGALTGAVLTDVPPGLHEYPNAFALRFLLAALITFAATFALAAGTMKTAIRVITGLVLFFIFGSIAVGFLERVLGVDDLITPIEILQSSLTSWPGPFHVFGGNWMLIVV
jgi:hypothetical protein